MKKGRAELGGGCFGGKGARGSPLFFCRCCKKKRDRTARHARPCLPPLFLRFWWPAATNAFATPTQALQAVPSKQGNALFGGGLCGPPLDRCRRGWRGRCGLGGKNKKISARGRQQSTGEGVRGRGRGENPIAGVKSELLRARAEGVAERPQSGAFAHRCRT